MATAPKFDREQWLNERRKGIGSSDVASLFPEDTKYGCTRELVFDKRSTPPDFERTESEEMLLKRGTKLEPLVAQEFSERYGFKVRRMPLVLDADNPVMRANLDYQIVKATTDQITGVWPGLKISGECGPGALECKTTNVFDYQRMVKQGIIPDYVFQLQWQLARAQYKWGVFALLEPDWWKLIVFAMTPDAILVQEMDRRALKVWEHIADKAKPLPPPLPSGDSRCYSCLWRKTCRGIQYLDEFAPLTSKEYEEDDSYSEPLSDLKTIRSKQEELEATESSIVGAIQARMTTEKKVKIAVPSVGATVRWQEQLGAFKWDGKALDAADGTIGRAVHFSEWAQERHPGIVAEFSTEQKLSPLLSAKYKFRAAPTRPFVVDFNEEDKRQ